MICKEDNLGLVSDYLENKIVDHVLRNKPYKSPDKIFVGLFYQDPTDASKYLELTGSGYKREYVKFDSPQNGLSRNAENVVFEKSTAKWKTVTHVGLFDSERGGNQLYHGSLTQPVEVPSGKNFYIKTGNLQAGID